jgi:hypothetical protein
MTTRSKTDPDIRWPDTLSAPHREQLARIKNAHAEASAAWKERHAGSKQIQIPHNEFLKVIGLKLDPTIFSRIISEKGYNGAAETHIETLTSAVEQWRMSKAFAQRMPDRPIHRQDWFADLEEAALNAAAMEEQKNQERGVVFLAPTGGGKSTLARHLKSKIGRAHIISAAGSWRTSYFAVLSSILVTLGQKVPVSARLAEASLLKHLNDNKLTLIFDEQDMFGRDALNLIRQLLNETRASVVMLMVPETWDRLVRHGGEYASQLCRRCSTVVKAPPLAQKDAMAFLKESLPDTPLEALKEAAKVLVSAANKFGGFSLLDNAAAALGDITLDPGETLAGKAAQVAQFYQQRHQTSLNIASAHRAA